MKDFAEELQRPVELPSDFRTKWLAALRSGKYVQGNGSLCDADHAEFRYCCMGVAGHVLNVPESVMKNRTFLHAPMALDGVIPYSLLDSANNLTDECQTFRGRCAMLNDVEKLTFPQIADWLEKNTIGV